MSTGGLTADELYANPPDTAAATVLKVVSLVVVIAAGLLENVAIIYTVIRDRKLHRAPYYYMINLSVADLLRCVICLPIVMVTVLNASSWKYGHATCALVAFTSTFFMFGALFALLILALDRHLSIVYPRFHARKFRGLMCFAVVLIAWAVSFLLSFPPVFGLGTYRFVPMEAQCTFEHKHYTDNDTFGFVLIFVTILALIVFLYVRIFRFLRSHRKMRPILYQPARSDNWAFFGPAANLGGVAGGGARNNLMGGFARAVTNPVALGLQNQPHMTGRYVNLQTDRNERLTRVFVFVSIIFLFSWAPYLVVCFWYVLDVTRAVPYELVTIATWLTFSQVSLVPLVFITCHRPFRRSMVTKSSSYVLGTTPVE